MKLILCTKCQDVVRLTHERRECECGRCWGRYVDGLNAVINKESIPLGFDNYSFTRALKNRPKSGWGETFDAFVIPEECGTVKIER